MAKVITETILCCDDCTFQSFYASGLYCNRLDKEIDIEVGDDFPYDCPLDDK